MPSESERALQAAARSVKLAQQTTGRIVVLEQVIGALIATHPDPAAARDVFDRAVHALDAERPPVTDDAAPALDAAYTEYLALFDAAIDRRGRGHGPKPPRPPRSG